MIDEDQPSIVECPHCHMRVLPRADHSCPACQMDMLDLEGVDPRMVSLIIWETDDLPSYCHNCNTFTDRFVRVDGVHRSGWNRFLDSLGTFLGYITARTLDVDDSNVIVHLPQCERCAEAGDPEALQVNYEDQNMTFLVHTGFKERVLQMDKRNEPADPESPEDYLDPRDADTLP